MIEYLQARQPINIEGIWYEKDEFGQYRDAQGRAMPDFAKQILQYFQNLNASS